MKLLTICDPYSPKIENLCRSLKNNLLFIDYDKSIGNLSKIFKFYDFLLSLSVPDDEVIVFVDAYDILCLKLEGMEEAFRSTKKDIIYGAEIFNIHQRPDVMMWFLKNFAERRLKFVNCGFAIGYYQSFVKMLSHIIENFEQVYRNKIDGQSEQMIISHFMMRNAKELHLMNIDIDSDAVFCLVVSSNLNKIDDIHSYFVHVPWLANPSQQAKYDKIISQYFLLNNYASISFGKFESNRQASV